MIPGSSRDVIGQPSTDLALGLIATIVEIVAIASKKITQERLIDTESDENEITNQLRQKMIEEKNARNAALGGVLTLRIEGEVGTFHTTAGRIDLKVIYDFDERNYFGVECKRLSKDDRSLDRKYVTNGLARFLAGKYSYNHQWGMMVGYVISGTCQQAADCVRERMCENSYDLHTVSSLAQETRFGNHRHLHSSRHRQETPQETIITVLHYFFVIPAAGS